MAHHEVIRIFGKIHVQSHLAEFFVQKLDCSIRNFVDERDFQLVVIVWRAASVVSLAPEYLCLTVRIEQSGTRSRARLITKKTNITEQVFSWNVNFI